MGCQPVIFTTQAGSLCQLFFQTMLNWEECVFRNGDQKLVRLDSLAATIDRQNRLKKDSLACLPRSSQQHPCQQEIATCC
jgi:hypothetical protein